LIWLLDDRKRSGRASPVPGHGIDPPADDDSRQHVAAAMHSFEKLDTTHSRHLDIEDQAIALARPTISEKLPARCELLRVEALAFEQKPKRIPHARIIVYDENRRLFRPHFGPIFAGLRSAALIRISYIGR
jgi:hypothetical protein